MKSNKIIYLAVAIIIVVALIGYTSSNKPSAPDVVRIGFIGPLTGGAAYLGEDGRNGAMLAVNEINSSGGVGGKKIELIYEDGKCSAKDGLSSAQKLVQVNHVKVIISASCGGEFLGYSDFAEKNEILLFATVASSPEVTKAGDYIFRNVPSDSKAGKELAEIVLKDYKKVAVITENTSFAQGQRDPFIESIKKLGGEVVSDEVFAPESSDFKTILLRVKQSNPEAVFINPQVPATSARLAKQIRDLGMYQQLYVTYSSGPDFSASGNSVEGTYIYDLSSLNSEKGVNLLQKYSLVYKKEPNLQYVAGSNYDAVYILANAIRKVGGDVDDIKKYLYNAQIYHGTIGDYSFDVNGDIVGGSYVLKKVVNQKAVEVK